MNRSKKIVYTLLFSLIVFWGVSFFKFYAIKSEVGFIERGDGIIYKDDERHQYFGMHDIKGKKYYFDPNTGYVSEGFKKVGSKTFYFNKNGKVNTGLKKIGKDTYYFNKDGSIIQNEISTIYVNGKEQKSGFDKDGKMYRSTSIDYNGVRLSFDQDGVLQYDTKYMKKQIQKIIGAYDGEVSVYFKDLSTRKDISINDRTFYPCCMIKLPALASVHQALEQGKIQYAPNQADIEKMIIVSDNTAYNNLMKEIGDGNGIQGLFLTNQMALSLGMKDTALHHGLKPGENFFTDGGDNVSSAKDSGIFFEALYDNKVVTPERSQEMLQLLKRTESPAHINLGFPPTIPFAHKTGDIDDKYFHDGGIVYLPNRNYILVIYTKKTTDHVGLMSEISKFIYDYQSVFAKKY